MIKLKEKTLAQVCFSSSKRYGNKTAFSLYQEGNICSERTITYKMMAFRASQIALLLKQFGIKEGDRVLLISENCPEWPLAWFGIALAGAVPVPLLTGFSPEQTGNIAAHAEVSAVILSRTMMLKTTRFTQTISSVPLFFLDSINENNTNEIIVSQNGQTPGSKEKRIPLPIPSGNDLEEFPQRKPEDLATIIYTSGTLGDSKGVMLSNLNLISCALSTISMVKINPRDRFLSVLPLAHSYEFTIGLLIPVICGASIAYLDRPPSASILLPVAKDLRPTAMATVPIFIEKMYQNAIVPKLMENKFYQNRFTRLLAIRTAGRKLNTALGGKIRYFGIGGAPLTAEVEKFLRLARFPYAPGYGLTETAPLVAGSAPRRFPFRSAGAVPKGVKVRIKCSGDFDKKEKAGEIQVRGPNVMLGYYRNEKLTREVFTEDGWLRTGDLGYMDEKRKLYVCGRIKSLILGPSGENIYPEEIEGLLGSSLLVEEALVYSTEKGEIIALVRLTDAAKAAAHAVEHALEDLRAWANKKLASFSRLSKIKLQNEPFEKTPTMKIKRYLYVL